MKGISLWLVNLVLLRVLVRKYADERGILPRLFVGVSSDKHLSLLTSIFLTL